VIEKFVDVAIDGQTTRQERALCMHRAVLEGPCCLDVLSNDDVGILRGPGANRRGAISEDEVEVPNELVAIAHLLFDRERDVERDRSVGDRPDRPSGVCCELVEFRAAHVPSLPTAVRHCTT
jgi:hypothetical protein